VERAPFGADYKKAVTEPGGWNIYMMMQGETIPKEENHVRLNLEEKDAWGMPLLRIAVGYDDDDVKSLNDFLVQGAEMLEKAKAVNIHPTDSKQAPGLDIHEMGGVRDGEGSKDFPAEQMEPIARLSECFCHRWGLYDFYQHPEPFAHFYGLNRTGSGSCSG
jgi:hypothetical protein